MSIAAKFQQQRNGHLSASKAAPTNIAVLTFMTYELTVELTKVTPEKAAEWFERNVANRPLSDSTWRRYCRIMSEGGWRVNGETIVFDIHGNLLNGQHRLKACIVSGKPFVALVIRGVDPTAFPTFDRNKIRNGADTLALSGRTNTVIHSAALVNLWRHLRGTHTSWETPEPAEIQALDAQCPTMDESVRYAGPFGKLTSKAVVAFCHYLFTSQDPDRAAQFFDGLLHGAELKKTSPVYMLRSRLLKERDKKGRLPIHEVIALFFKAWVAYRDNVPIGALRWRGTGDRPESFPSID